ncbi:MAG TPA: restriction endonuclease [Terriglobales bacterium]|nr:restriction endonuclease [Terriglobales bacterium]
MPKSDLPFGSEFSPSNIDLKTVLEFAAKHGGDNKAFENAVHDAFFSEKKFPNTSEYNRRKRANNTNLGLRAYRIVDDNATLTEFGKTLHELRDKPKELHDALAKHILLNLHGTTLVQTIQDMQASGEDVNLNSLREWLDERGVHFPRGGKHASMMKLWLERAGIFSHSGWRINEARLQEVRGIGTLELEALAKLNPGQRFFLRTMLNLGTTGKTSASEVEKLATATYGFKYNEKGLAKDILYPLEKAGYITVEKTSRAKSPIVQPTEKLLKEIFEPLLQQLEKQTTEDLRPLLRKPLAEIVKELSSEDKHIKGLALETLAFKLMRFIDLDYVMTRLRGAATGGAEVDVIFESGRLVFSRWQVQCKNTGTVSLDDVAKEVGLTHFLKSNVIVIVSTGDIGSEARRYANKIMRDSNLAIVMIDRGDIEGIIGSPVHILDVLNREAKHAMKLKVLEL